MVALHPYSYGWASPAVATRIAAQAKGSGEYMMHDATNINILADDKAVNDK